MTNTETIHEGKTLPLTCIFGDAKEGTMSVNEAVGLEQDNDNPEFTNILYTGDNYYDNASRGGNDILKYNIEAPLRDVFKLMMEAHKKGEVADLSDDRLRKEHLLPERQPEPAKKKGFLARLVS